MLEKDTGAQSIGLTRLRRVVAGIIGPAILVDSALVRGRIGGTFAGSTDDDLVVGCFANPCTRGGKGPDNSE